MTPQNKLVTGMVVFLVCFFLAFLVIQPSFYRRYFDDVRRRNAVRLIKPLMIGVWVLALPYFYDQLVGLDNHWLSAGLGLVLGLAAYVVLADVSWFAYRTFGPPSRRA